jgi:metal-responsive CopG/Arc/MetJ family transcriptional regulator
MVEHIMKRLGSYAKEITVKLTNEQMTKLDDISKWYRIPQSRSHAIRLMIEDTWTRMEEEKNGTKPVTTE